MATVLALSACSDNQEEAPPASAAATPHAKVTPAPTAATSAASATSLKVTSVDLGKAVDPGQKISEPATTFSTQDVIYASVSTAGSAPDAVLTAKWTYKDGQLVNQTSQAIAPDEDAVTSFHISKPDGWPTGSYKVEILLNGQSVATKEFSVQ
ncbi:MAG: hypothetical protein LBQ20_01995 [Rhodanobacter sp.]|nr:hypothetical protein [Rhodanobacter sp.]